MSDSDDFDVAGDDTAFLAAATQAEANQDFYESPRAAKRRRVDTFVNDEDDSGFRSGFLAREQLSNISQAANATAQEEADDEHYFSGELEGAAVMAAEARKARMERYKIHVTKNARQLPTAFVSQTQAGSYEDPAAIRGPIWKKHSAAESAAPVTVSAAMPPPQQSRRSFERSVSASTLDGFVLRPNQNAHNRLPAQRLPQTAQPTVCQRTSTSTGLDQTEYLEDISSDAFDEVIQEKPALRGPQAGLKQMTIFGETATQPLATSQTAKKKHSWPVKIRDEPPTHHELNSTALETFTYPTNLGAVRDYQFNIVSRSLLHNTLVALPTGLGKTFIAATIMLNYYRWTKQAQIVFMAPTKPLIAQQMEACYGIAGIPRCDTVLMTGETQPAIRAEEWLERRVFFMTPQTIINDLKTGTCDPKRLVLVVVDEAHKATGGYAYTEVIKFLHRFNQSFRVLALTATPGSSVEAVQAVIDNLGIARVELRTEASIDIRQYTHEKHTDTQLFSFSEEQTLIMGHISKAIQPVLDKLNSQNAYWSRDPMSLTPFGCTTARGKWMASDAGKKAPFPIKGMVNSIFVVLASIAHSINLLKFHGIGIFYSSMISFQKTLEDDQAKRKYARQIVESTEFVKAMNYMRGWCNNIDFVGHPKMEYLREVVTNHFLDAGEAEKTSSRPARATRIMIFSSFRDSTDEICRVLKRSEPLVRPHVFVGQAASKSTEGMDQKKQTKVIQDFKDGVYNTLVATSIGEEGLDIGDVDLIICYDGSASPIRMLQRIGRTGRKRVGKVVLLLMRGKEENDYAKAQDSYAYIQKTIADDSKYAYRDDQDHRILPKGISPVPNKQIVDIPPENTQPIDLNERARSRKGKKSKRPSKKFHMPDGVRTGFVQASALPGSDEDDSDMSDKPVRRPAAKKAVITKTRVLPPPEVAAVPFLEDVLLTTQQMRDHDRRFARVPGYHCEGMVEAPDPSQHEDAFRTAQPSKYVAHGRAGKLFTKVLSDMHVLNDLALDHIRMADQASAEEIQCGVTARLARDRAVTACPPDIVRECSGQQNASAIRKHKSAVPKQRRTTNGLSTVKRANAKAKRTKQSAPRRVEDASDAMEGSDSSPEPTPADMRIGTQGIDLGSKDTSGEDDDEEADSELENFVVNSDQSIELLTSSLPMEHEFSSSMPVNRNDRQRLARRRALVTVSEEEQSGLPSDEDQSIMDNTSDSDVQHENNRRCSKPAQSRQRVLQDSDDDDA